MVTSASLPEPPYLCDTNIFVDLGERIYPPDIFEAFWKALEDALTDGRILTCKTVLAELKRASNPEPWRAIVQRCCGPHAIDESEAAIQSIFGRLAGLKAGRTLSSTLSDEDLLILSAAEARNLPLATRDGKMMKACNDGHVVVEVVTLTAVFRGLGWKFS